MNDTRFIKRSFETVHATPTAGKTPHFEFVYAKTQKITNIDKTKHNNIGYLGRISYNYNDTSQIVD